VQNSLAAAGAAAALGLDLPAIAAGLQSCGSVPGRLQRVIPADGRERGYSVLVDYAHTDDALANVLSALRPLTRGRLIALFGCGGDRDASKRPRMARVAAGLADRVVVTSDNPRTEDPHRIIEQILAGFEPGQMQRVLVEPDRRRAIASAVAMAAPGDVVLLAGKGHENYQIIGKERLPFDDAAVAAEALARSEGRAA
ncbi:MAG: UDP-N-acetylmuramoyl-L-alanyl-D-glutamate--2,6-diaminopimelate ligase, partial [Phycisphaerae bacterium]